MPRAIGAVYCCEAARATSLAAHSAAALATSSGFLAAARLLRSAEALARAATAVLAGGGAEVKTDEARDCDGKGASKQTATGAATARTSSARSDRRRRHRLKKKADADTDMVKEKVDDEVLAVVGGDPAASGSRRTLGPKSSRERSPQGAKTRSALLFPSASSAADPSGIGPFQNGQNAILGGLVSRPELSGAVTVLSGEDVNVLQFDMTQLVRRLG